MDTLPVRERYSYVFDGNSQVLDQILVSPRLLLPFPEYDSVHVNAEFADQAFDHDPQIAPGGAIAALLVLLALAAPLRIHDIQGRGDVSPRAGDTVAGVAGVVTAVTDGGLLNAGSAPGRDPRRPRGSSWRARTRQRGAGDAVRSAARSSRCARATSHEPHDHRDRRHLGAQDGHRSVRRRA